MKGNTQILEMKDMLEVRTIVMVGVARKMMPEGWGLMQRGSMMEMSRVRLVGMEMGNLSEGVTMVMMYRNKQTISKMMLVGKGSLLKVVEMGNVSKMSTWRVVSLARAMGMMLVGAEMRNMLKLWLMGEHLIM